MLQYTEVVTDRFKNIQRPHGAPLWGLNDRFSYIILSKCHRGKGFWFLGRLNFRHNYLTVLLYSSLSNRLKIFPAALLGSESTKRTPAAILLYGATWPATNSFISFSPMADPSLLSTTYASGASPVLSSGTPMTAASTTLGWVLSSPSSSAGGTYGQNNLLYGY